MNKKEKKKERTSKLIQRGNVRLKVHCRLVVEQTVLNFVSFFFFLQIVITVKNNNNIHICICVYVYASEKRMYVFRIVCLGYTVRGTKIHWESLSR